MQPPPNPLLALQLAAAAELIPYGPPDSPIQIVQSFGHYHAEYAAIRKSTAILHLPHRGLVCLTGKDRAPFLHSLLTNEVNKLTPSQGCHAFLLSKAGRIAADIVLLHNNDRSLLDLDVFQARTLPIELNKFLFTEDVQLADLSDQFTHLALHGPASPTLLTQLAPNLDPSTLSNLSPFQHLAIQLLNHPCTLYRRDDTGSPGFHLLVPQSAATDIYQSLSSAVGGIVPNVDQVTGPGPKRPIPGRAIGWLAYNTARIEAGTPLFHIDFGLDSLPHETGVLKETVSFTKGCYVGQEIVARMQNLGHPKRVLAGLKLPNELLPIAGAQIFDPQTTPPSSPQPQPNPPVMSPTAQTTPSPNASPASIVGAVTSSTLSPMLGNTAIAFASLKWGKHSPGTQLLVPAEGRLIPATVHPLRFLPNLPTTT